MVKGPLAGIRVLDLSAGVAGAYCTRLLAGLGADVIKIEPPHGSALRGIGPWLSPSDQRESGALFQYLDAAKRSIVLDLTNKADRSKAHQLVNSANLIVNCAAPQSAIEPPATSAPYSGLYSGRPGLVSVSITPFGQGSAYAAWPWSEAMLLAFGGMVYTCGDPQREPLFFPGHQVAYLTGLHAVIGGLAALRQAERTGIGQHIEVSMLEAVVATLEASPAMYAHQGTLRQRQGNRHGTGYPMTIRPCKDGYVGVMIGSEVDWEHLAILSEIDEFFDPRFADGEARAAMADEIDALLEPWLMRHSRAELFHAAQEYRLPFAMVLSPAEILDDPQEQAREFFQSIKHPSLGDVTLLGAPFRMNAANWVAERAPLLGEHTVDVLAALCDDPQTAPAPTEACFDQGGLPLAGVRIVDLTTMWAGPYCTSILAELGAEVIKIEPRFRPDGTRATPGYFEWLNHDKLSLPLDLRSGEARELFLRLVEQSDVVVENFSPRVMVNFGLEYATLCAHNPALIMLSMPAYGSDGPYRDYVAFGPATEAMAGFSSLLGYTGGPPMLTGSAYGDPVAGLHGAVAVLAALRQREHTGEGQKLEISQREALMQLIGEVFVAAGAGIAVPPRRGNDDPALVPQGCYRCAGDERWVAISVADDRAWVGLCEAIGCPTLATSPEYQTVEGRREHHGELDRVIQRWMSQHEREDVVRELLRRGVAAAVVSSAADLADNQHLKQHGFFISVRSENGETYAYPGLPFRAPGLIRRDRSPAPTLGRDARYILSERLGLSSQAIATLMEKGGVG